MTINHTTFDNLYYREMTDKLQNTMFPCESEYQKGRSECSFFVIQDIIEFLATIMDNYENLDANALALLFLENDKVRPTEPLRRPRLSVTLLAPASNNSYEDLIIAQSQHVYQSLTYELTPESPLGPLNSSTTDLPWFFNALVRMTLTLEAFDVDFPDNEPELVKWVTVLSFEAIGGGLKVSFSSHPFLAHSSDIHEMFRQRQVLVVLVLCVAFALAGLSLQALARSLHTTWVSRRRQPLCWHSYTEWCHVRWYHKVSFLLQTVRMEHCLAVISSGLIAAYCLAYVLLAVPNNNFVWMEVLLGLSVFLCYFALLWYFKYVPPLFVLNRSVIVALPQALQLLAGVLPIYFAYCFLSVASMGSYSERFADLRGTSVTLFSLMNGDSFIDIFDSAYHHDAFRGFLSECLLYSFAFLFMYVVLSIFIVIVEMAYHAANEGIVHKQTSKAVAELVDCAQELIDNKPGFENFESSPNLPSEHIGLSCNATQSELLTPASTDAVGLAFVAEDDEQLASAGGSPGSDPRDTKLQSPPSPPLRLSLVESREIASSLSVIASGISRAGPVDHSRSVVGVRRLVERRLLPLVMAQHESFLARMEDLIAQTQPPFSDLAT